MAAEKRCDCCDVPEWMCGKTAEIAQRQEELAVRQRALMEPGVKASLWPFTCARCRTSYPPGEPLWKSEDGWTGAICCPRVDE